MKTWSYFSNLPTNINSLAIKFFRLRMFPALNYLSNSDVDSRKIFHCCFTVLFFLFLSLLFILFLLFLFISFLFLLFLFLFFLLFFCLLFSFLGFIFYFGLSFLLIFLFVLYFFRCYFLGCFIDFILCWWIYLFQWRLWTDFLQLMLSILLYSFDDCIKNI